MDFAAARHFRNKGKFGIDFAAYFAAAKEVYDFAKWRPCAKEGFRSYETPFEMVTRL